MPKASDQLEQVGTLNQEALMFVKQNAFESAVEILTKAEDIDPRHPDTLKNLAQTYQKMNDAAQSKIYWQRLVDLGPGVGTVYAVAVDHVVLLGGHASDILNDTSTSSPPTSMSIRSRRRRSRRRMARPNSISAPR